MQNLDVDKSIIKNWKNTEEIKKKTIWRIYFKDGYGRKKLKNSENAAEVLQEFEQIIISKKTPNNMASLPARKNFQKIKEKEKFVTIVNEFGDSKSTIVKLIIKHPKKLFIIFALF